MKKEDVQIGMKVVPHQKTVSGWGRLQNSEVWEYAKNNNQEYLYVVRENTEDDCFILSDELDGDGDYFNSEDFELYIN